MAEIKEFNLLKAIDTDLLLFFYLLTLYLLLVLSSDVNLKGIVSPLNVVIIKYRINLKNVFTDGKKNSPNFLL